jgi:hypothetical protein
MKKTSNGQLRFWTILFGSVFPFIFTLVSFMLNPDIYLAWFVATDKLMTTQGIITSSTMNIEGSASKNALAWVFNIEYEYKVNDKIYTSNKVNYGYIGSSDISYAESYIKKYPEGKAVLVYYHPGHPDQSVLDPFTKNYQNLYFILGSIFFGLFIIWIGLNNK